MFKRVKLKSKMLLSICGTALLAFSITIVCITQLSTQNATKEALGLVNETASRYGGEVESEISSVFHAATIMADMLGKVQGSENAISRGAVVDMLNSVAMDHEEYFGTWTVWHPDSFDGPDANADPNQPGVAENGQFRPNWQRYGGPLKLKFTVFPPEGDANGGWYWIPFRTGRPFVTPPMSYKHNGKNVTLISVCVPIRSGGKSVGVAGIDFSMKKMKDIVSEITPFDNGYGTLLFTDGSIVAHPDGEMVGKKIASRDAISAVEKGEVLAEYGRTDRFKGESLTVYTPVSIGLHDSHWSLAVTVSMDKVLEKVRHLRNISIAIGLISLAILFAVVYILATRIIIKPINAVVNELKEIAQGEGDLTRRLNVDSKDEIGDLAHWLNTFMEKLHDIIQNVTEKTEIIGRSSTELHGISSDMTEISLTTSNKTSHVAGGTQKMSRNIVSVAASMEQTSTNIELVASATEEMTSTINEIASNSEKARSISDSAVEQAKGAFDKMAHLGTAAQEIGNITATISEISEQTNLLALNATIEAARAGEAGKGFAVVAGEIKELARQTADATMDIKRSVEGIQDASSQSVEKIDGVSKTICNVNEIISGIAAAIEEQSIATKEISENILQAAQGIQDSNESVNQNSVFAGQISKDVEEVNGATLEISKNSEKVSSSSERLSSLFKELSALMDQFKL